MGERRENGIGCGGWKRRDGRVGWWVPFEKYKGRKEEACDVSTREVSHRCRPVGDGDGGTTPNEYTQSWGKVCNNL